MSKSWKIFIVLTFCIAVAGLYAPAFNQHAEMVVAKKMDELMAKYEAHEKSSVPNLDSYWKDKPESDRQ